MLTVIIKYTPKGLTQMELFANAAVTVSRRQGDVVGIALVVDQQTLGRDASTVHFHQASIHFAETRIVDFESGSGKDMWKTVIGVDVWLCSDLETARACAGEAANRWNVACPMPENMSNTQGRI